MTPLAGFVAAVVAGWIIRDPRRAAAAVIVPFLAVLAAQTWILASGHGINPPSTPDSASYWVFQAIFLAFALGIAIQLASWRRAGVGAGDAQDVSRRTLRASAVLTALTAVFLTGYLLDARPVLHHNTSAPLPVTGVIGIVALILSLVVVSVLNIRGRRRAAIAAS
jgi:hypothetical protein